MAADAFIDIVPVESLHDRLGLSATDSSLESVFKPLIEWSPHTDDAPILRYIFRHVQPKRHIEFGAADTAGAGVCLEECQATVWRTNPPRDASPAGDNRFGHRVWQRLGEGDEWDRSVFTPGFFDSAVIYGSPAIEGVSADTRTALSLVRSGGLIIWRGFCPDPALFDMFDTVGATVRSVLGDWPNVSASLADAFWIRPSFLLAAVRR